VLYEKPGRSGWGFQSGQELAGEPYRPAIVAGRYRVTGVLSRGPKSDVVTAIDVREDRQVVAKRLRSPDRATGSRLRQAHQVLSGLRVPEVAPVCDLLEGKTDSWLIWERVAGSSLREYRATLPISNGAGFHERWDHVGPVFDAILHGLERMHRSQLPHLDLKPSNVLVRPDGSPVLVDLGVGGSAVSEGEQQYENADRLGDLGFQSPEQALGNEVGPLSDQWSLAALLYFLLTGHQPVKVEDASLLAQAYERCEVKVLREYLSDTPEALDEVVMRMLEWDPTGRYEDLNSVREALKQFSQPRRVAVDQLWAADPPPLVGRDPFLAFFAKRLRELDAGTGCVIQVVAEKGYGKTRLLSGWEEAARVNSSATVYSASCLPSQPRAVLHPWFRPPACDVEQPPPEDLVEQALEGFDGPTVLLFDALEETDSISWSRLHRVAAAALDGECASPLMVVLAGRQLPDLAPRIDRDNPLLFNVVLPPLSPADVADLLRPESSDDDDIAVRDSAAATFCEECQGLPGALLATLLAEQRAGRLERDGRRWIARVGQSIDEQIMRARPAKLDDMFALLISLGTSVEVGIALHCLPMTTAEILDGLDWAVQNELISFRVVGDHWYLVFSESTDIPVEEPSVRLVSFNERVAKWLEVRGEHGGLTAERTGARWRAAAAQRAAGEAYLRAAAANESIGSNSESRRLSQVGRTLSPRG